MHLSMMRLVRGFPVAVVLAVLVPFEGVGQDLAGGPAAHAAGFRELAVPGTREFPGLLYSKVHASDGDRKAVEALADTMVAVALDLSVELDREDDRAIASRETFRAILRVLSGTGSWPATARRGTRFDGAGERLIRIAMQMPMTQFDPLNRSYPLRVLASLPDEDKWKQKLVELARGPYPVSAAAVVALWDAFRGEGRELVTEMYRRDELNAQTKSWVDFLRDPIHDPFMVAT